MHEDTKFCLSHIHPSYPPSLFPYAPRFCPGEEEACRRQPHSGVHLLRITRAQYDTVVLPYHESLLLLIRYLLSNLTHSMHEDDMGRNSRIVFLCPPGVHDFYCFVDTITANSAT